MRFRTTRIPEASLTIDGGNFSTSRQDGSIGGAVQRLDYFADLSHFGTDNSTPNNAYHNTTFAGRFGVSTACFRQSTDSWWLPWGGLWAEVTREGFDARDP